MYLIFGMCDETFSVHCSAKPPKDVDEGWFMLFVTLLNQIYWVVGATLGGIFGSIIPFNTKGIDFVLIALFVVIFLDQWLSKKQSSAGVCRHLCFNGMPDRLRAGRFYHPRDDSDPLFTGWGKEVY